MFEVNQRVEDYIRGSYSTDGDTEKDTDARMRHLLKRLAVPPLFTTLRLNPLAGDIETVSRTVMEIIQKQSKDRGRPPPVMYMHPVLKDVLVIEVKGPNNVDKLEKEVIVDVPCGAAVLRGADVFAQGILGAPANLLAKDHVSVFADLDQTFLRGRIKPHSGRKFHVGNGIVQFSRDEIFKANKKLSGVGVLMTEPLYEAPSLNAIAPSLAFPQNLPSAICSRVLDPQPGEVILDMCAAPGGKTTHIAALMQNKGRVIALDKVQRRVEKVQQNATNWNLSCVECYTHDSTQSLDHNADDTGGPPYPPATFDRILLDAPCSALGQRPSLKDQVSLQSVKSHPVQQRQLFEKAVELLKPHGTLVYSTCTITKEEDEEQVAWALKQFPCLELQAQVPHIGGPGRPYDGLSEENSKKLQFFDPTSVSEDTKLTVDNDSISFFIAKFRKKS